MQLQNADLIAHFIDHCERRVGHPMGAQDRSFTQRHFQAVRVKKAAFLIRAGEVPQQLAFTVAGLLRCFQIDWEGREITKHFCSEGSFCSSYGALISGQESRLFIQALEDCVVLQAPYRVIAATIHHNPFFLLLMKRCLEDIVLHKETREEELLAYNAQERYTRFLRQYPQIEARVTNEHIASYLGITPESLSRIRKNLRGLPIGK